LRSSAASFRLDRYPEGMEAAAVLEAAVVDIARSPFLRVLLRNYAIVVPLIFRRTPNDIAIWW
jgi:hypothetical protein